MTKEAIWQMFLDRNPDVAAGNDYTKLRMTKGSLRRFIYWTYMEAQRKDKVDLPDFMKGLFN